MPHPGIMLIVVKVNLLCHKVSSLIFPSFNCILKRLFVQCYQNGFCEICWIYRGLIILKTLFCILLLVSALPSLCNDDVLRLYIGFVQKVTCTGKLYVSAVGNETW